MTDRVRRRVLVSGRVQGVFFRGATEEEARRVGACGWVRNLVDGRVEAVFEGPPDVVDAMVAFVHLGPRHASVRDVEVIEEAPEGSERFEVRVGR